MYRRDQSANGFSVCADSLCLSLPPGLVSFQKLTKWSQVELNRPRQVSDAQICETARDVFVRQGPHAPISAIAERLGVSSAALFKRFGSKDSLMLAALAPPPLTSLSWFQQLEAGPLLDLDAKIQLHQVAVEIARFLEMMVPQIACLAASGIAPVRAATLHHPIPVPVQTQRCLAAFIEKAQDQKKLQSGNATKMAYALLGALHMRAFTLHLAPPPTGDETVERFVESLLQVLWSGLAPEPRCPSPQSCLSTSPETGGHA